MKKMMLMAVAVLAAVVSQAVGLQWSAAGLTDYVGATAYLINTKDASVSDVTELLKGGTTDLSSVAWGSPGTVASNGGISVPAGTGEGKSNVSFDYTGTPIENTAFITVLFNTDKGLKYGFTGEKTVTTKSSTGNAIFAFANVANTITWTEPTGGGGDDPIIPDVPEPTSMALVALGAAAFGLRRKLRK